MVNNNPVLNYDGFLKENNMKTTNFKDLNGSWDTNHPSNNKDVPKVNAEAATRPLLNLFIENDYTVLAGAGCTRSERFGKDGSSLKIGTDLDKKLVYTISIGKVWTEDLLEREYGEDWRNDGSASELLGKAIDDETLIYNFFTNYTNPSSPDFIEHALRYAQQYYKIYKDLKINCRDYYDLFESPYLMNYLERTGVVVKSNRDIPDFLNTAQRAYHDAKVMYIAEEENYFSREFLHQFLTI